MPDQEESKFAALSRLARERREDFRRKLSDKLHHDTKYALISRGTPAGYDKHLMITAAGWVDLFRFYAAEDDPTGKLDISHSFSLSPSEFRSVVLAYAKEHPDIVEMLNEAQDSGYAIPDRETAMVDERDLRIVGVVGQAQSAG